MTLGKQKIISRTVSIHQSTVPKTKQIEVAMLRSSVIFLTIFLLASCQHKQKIDEQKAEEQTQEQTAEETIQVIDDEEQAAALDQQTQEQIEEIEVQDRVFFGYDSDELSADAKKILDTQAAWLKSDVNIKATIEGHCDERGTREYNIALGEKRANVVKNYLVQSGLDKSRFQTISYGKERPAFFGADEENMSKNRRAVVVVN